MITRFTNHGFTLLEILIALILFTVGVIAIAGLFGTGLASSFDTENTIIAINLAQRRMEEIRNLDFDTQIVNEVKADVDGFPGFQREVLVTQPESDLTEVTVNVYWTFKGDEISAPLQSYISKN